MIVHKIVVWLNGFRTRPNVRRSAWIGKECIVPKSCIVGERVKLKHRVVLGENCFVNDDVYAGGLINIGKGCRIENKVKISSCNTVGNWHTHGELFPVNGFVSGEGDVLIEIGNYVAIEDSCVITKGVRIGDKAVIMAGSVVYDNVPAFAIVRGNPAKIIGYRKTSNKIKTSSDSIDRT